MRVTLLHQPEILLKPCRTTTALDETISTPVQQRLLVPNAIISAWLRLAKRAGLQGIRLHDARHTHASLMLKQGVHPKIVQESLGHSTIAVTLDTYSHVVPGLQEAAAAGFDQLLGRSPRNEAVYQLEDKCRISRFTVT